MLLASALSHPAFAERAVVYIGLNGGDIDLWAPEPHMPDKTSNHISEHNTIALPTSLTYPAHCFGETVAGPSRKINARARRTSAFDTVCKL